MYSQPVWYAGKHNPSARPPPIRLVGARAWNLRWCELRNGVQARFVETPHPQHFLAWGTGRRLKGRGGVCVLAHPDLEGILRSARFRVLYWRVKFGSWRRGTTARRQARRGRGCHHSSENTSTTPPTTATCMSLEITRSHTPSAALPLGRSRRCPVSVNRTCKD